MRIGLLIYGELASVSGGYLYNRQLVSYLQRQGEQVEIISLPQRRFGLQLTDNFKQSLLQAILALKLDVLIEDAMVHPSMVWLNTRLLADHQLPVLALVHLLQSFEQHPGYSLWAYRALERYYFSRVSGIIANSQTTLAQLKTLVPAALPPQCVAVPSADHLPPVTITAQDLQQKALQSGALKVLVVGNVIRRKGLHVLINALGLMPNIDVQVNVAGRLDMEPEYVQSVHQQLKSIGLEARVKLLGVITGQNLVELYHQHQLMVLASSYESYGIVYVEALQFGLPIIGTTAGAAKEIIQPAVNGYLIPPEDATALAEILTALHLDRSLLSTLSKTAWHSYQSYPRWDTSCAIIHQFLKNY